MITAEHSWRITGGALLTPRFLWAATEVPMILDHILLGCSDLDQGIAFVEQHTGVRPAIGGVHPGRGTRNALLSLGEMRYLEVIAPDPAQAGQKSSRESMVAELKSLRRHKSSNGRYTPRTSRALRRVGSGRGLRSMGPTPGSRKRPDGKVLNWQTLNLQDNRNGLLPFFIQWGADTTHPLVDRRKVAG